MPRRPAESRSGLRATGVWFGALVAAVLVVDLASPFLVTVDDVVDAIDVPVDEGTRLMVVIMFTAAAAGVACLLSMAFAVRLVLRRLRVRVKPLVALAATMIVVLTAAFLVAVEVAVALALDDARWVMPWVMVAIMFAVGIAGTTCLLSMAFAVQLAFRRLRVRVKPLVALVSAAMIGVVALGASEPLGDCWGGALSAEPLHCYILEEAQRAGVIDVDAIFHTPDNVLYVFLSSHSTTHHHAYGQFYSPLVYDKSVVKFIDSKTDEFVERWPERVFFDHEYTLGCVFGRVGRGIPYAQADATVKAEVQGMPAQAL